MTESEAIYLYVDNLIRRLEKEYKEAEDLYENTLQNYREAKWLKAELLDLVDKQDALEEKQCSLYYILNEDQDLIKIGIRNNVKNRIQNMQTSTGYYLELLKEIQFDNREEALKAEKFLHDNFENFRRKPHKIFKTSEWFDVVIKFDLMKYFNTREKILEAIETHEEEMRKSMEYIKII